MMYLNCTKTPNQLHQNANKTKVYKTKVNDISFSKSIYSYLVNNSDYDKTRGEMKKQIDFNLLKNELPDESTVDDIMEIMVEVMASQKEYFIIGGDAIPAIELKKRISKIGKEDIELLISNLKKQKSRIVNIKAYLLKSLYNLPVTANAYWDNIVRADGMT